MISPADQGKVPFRHPAKTIQK